MSASRTRVVAAITAALLSLGLAACQPDDGAEPSTSTDQGGEEPVPGEEGAPEPSPSPDADDTADGEDITDE